MRTFLESQRLARNLWLGLSYRYNVYSKEIACHDDVLSLVCLRHLIMATFGVLAELCP